MEKAFDELDEYTKVLYGDKFKNGGIVATGSEALKGKKQGIYSIKN